MGKWIGKTASASYIIMQTILDVLMLLTKTHQSNIRNTVGSEFFTLILARLGPCSLFLSSWKKSAFKKIVLKELL